MLGKPVPDFSLPSTGRSSLDPTFQLSTTRGSKVVLYFYPIRDPYLDLRRVRRHVFGISRDALGSQERSKEKIRFPFELLADPAEAVCEQFGVTKQKVPGHVQEVLNFVKAL